MSSVRLNWVHVAADIVVILGLLVFAGWLGISGIAKLHDSSGLRAALETHGVVPAVWQSSVSIGLTIFEVGLAGAIVISVGQVQWLRWSGLVAISVMAMFCGYLLLVMIAGSGNVPCGCGQETSQTVYHAFAIDLGVLALLVSGWWCLLRRPASWTG